MTFSFEECLTIANDETCSEKQVSEALKWIKVDLKKSWEIDTFFQVSSYVFRCYVKNTSKVTIFFADDELNLSIPREQLKAYCGCYQFLQQLKK